MNEQPQEMTEEQIEEQLQAKVYFHCQKHYSILKSNTQLNIAALIKSLTIGTVACDIVNSLNPKLFKHLRKMVDDAYIITDENANKKKIITLDEIQK